MSFTPLPTIFTETCLDREISFPQILELGCGDGCFREVLTQAGVASWGLDSSGPERGTVAQVVGDALSPPVVPGSLDVLIVPNLLRHLIPGHPTLGFLPGWMELLKPGGSLFIFEDEPADTPDSVAHYRDLMEFLRRLMPKSRGPLLPLREFQALVEAGGSAVDWEFGEARNRYPINAQAVLDFLGRPERAEAWLRGLIEGISRDGLDPGVFWWARARTVTKGTRT